MVKKNANTGTFYFLFLLFLAEIEFGAIQEFMHFVRGTAG